MPRETLNLSEALWRIYRRPERPIPWELDGNLPWNDPAFSERMLAQHLDQSHGAASRTHEERRIQLAWLWSKLNLAQGDNVLDFTCGPGLYAVDLALKGCHVSGIDFSPASIAFARELAAENKVQDRCRFRERDVREVDLPHAAYDAALFIYGQLAVFPRDQALDLLKKIAASLKPGARFVLELLNKDRVDKAASTWWFTDDTGLWGDTPYLHLGERQWLAEENIAVERFFVIDLKTHEMLTVNLSDQSYADDEMAAILTEAGFGHVDTYPGWDDLPLNDAAEWIVYIAQK